jgi:mannose-6-phosphate isomerase-like protein (cupin superfamily)
MGIREVNRKKRLQYARGKVHWTVDRNWKHVIFSDEMTIVIRRDGKIKVWRKTSEKWLGCCLGYLILSLGPSYTLKLMVWGSITNYGTGLLAFVDGNMNSQKYIDTLEHYLWPVITKHFSNQHWYFMDGNASVHRSVLTEAWRQDNNLPTFFWSPQSPDLNPIENV